LSRLLHVSCVHGPLSKRIWQAPYKTSSGGIHGGILSRIIGRIQRWIARPAEIGPGFLELKERSHPILFVYLLKCLGGIIAYCWLLYVSINLAGGNIDHDAISAISLHLLHMGGNAIVIVRGRIARKIPPLCSLSHKKCHLGIGHQKLGPVKRQYGSTVKL